MSISIIFSVNQDVIQVHNDKNVKLFCKDLVDLFLEACWYVCLAKKHYLVLKVTISSPEHAFLLLLFADFHLMVGIGEVELGELFSSF